MYLFTYDDINQKLGNDLDITDEAFVSATELRGYINEAIDDAQAAVHNLNHEDKYFLKQTTFSWVDGTASYDLPTDIYANKIRSVFYSSGDSQYEIPRIKDLRATLAPTPGSVYSYIIMNPTAGDVPQAVFFPTPNETSTNAILWYIREMMKVTADNQDQWVCEIPECQNFVFAHCKYSVMKKTRRADLIAASKQDRDEQYVNMIQNLNQMVLDEDNLIQQDLGWYDPFLLR